MQPFKTILSLSAIVAGVLIILTGLSAIILYLATVIDSLQQPDKSLIYWYLPFLLIGISLLPVGAWFSVIGYKSFEDEYFFMLTRNSLLVLIITGGLFLGWWFVSENRADDHRQQREASQAEIDDLQQIKRVDITSADETGIDLSVSAVGKHSGIYRLNLKVHNTRNLFMEQVSDHTLQNTDNLIPATIHFDDVFRICREGRPTPDNYFCVNNTGTSNSKITISASLSPVDHPALDKITRAQNIESEASSELYLDTTTRNGVVTVDNVRINQP